MSTIRTVQEAYEALCDGEYFQVGGQIIDPDDIVRVDRSLEEPIFFLSDGTTVQHDRFQSGDVGDFLAEALNVATRGVQSEKIKPTYNRVLDMNSSNVVVLLTKDGAVLTSFESSYYALLWMEQDRVLSNDDGTVDLYNAGDGSTVGTATFSITPGSVGLAIDSAGYALGNSTTPKSELLKILSDGTTAQVAFDGGASPDGSFGTGADIVERSLAIGENLKSDGFAFFCDESANAPNRLPLDGSTQSSRFNNAPGLSDVSSKQGAVYHEEENILAIVYKKLSVQAGNDHILVEYTDPGNLSSPNQIVTNLASTIERGDNYRLRSFYKGKYVILRQETGQLYLVTRDGNVDRVINNVHEGQDVGLDLSAV